MNFLELLNKMDTVAAGLIERHKLVHARLPVRALVRIDGKECWFDIDEVQPHFVRDIEGPNASIILKLSRRV